MPTNLSDEVAEAKRQNEAIEAAQRKKRTAADVDPEPEKESDPDPSARRRVFVAPADLNGKYLAHGGTVLMQPSPNGPWPVSRNGDIWVQFQSGIIVVDPSDPSDAVRLGWLIDHPDIARDAADPATDLWAKLIEDKHPTSHREASLPSNVNVDEILAGNMESLGSSSLMKRARAAV